MDIKTIRKILLVMGIQWYGSNKIKEVRIITKEKEGWILEVDEKAKIIELK